MNTRYTILLSTIPDDPDKARELLEKVNSNEVDLYPGDEDKIISKLNLAVEGVLKQRKLDELRRQERLALE